MYQVIPDWQPQALATVPNICHPMCAADHHPYGNVRLIVDDTICAWLVWIRPDYPAKHGLVECYFAWLYEGKP